MNKKPVFVDLKKLRELVSKLDFRLKTLFNNEKTLAQWESIKTQRDNLDVAIYELTEGQQKSAEEAMALLEKISDPTLELSRRMIAETQHMKNQARMKH